MITPKEKAIELVEKFIDFVNCWDNNGKANYTQAYKYAKQCALIVVDEIIKSQPRNPNDVDWHDAGGTHQYYYEAQHEEALIYWQEVKTEIEKL